MECIKKNNKKNKLGERKWVFQIGKLFGKLLQVRKSYGY